MVLKSTDIVNFAVRKFYLLSFASIAVAILVKDNFKLQIMPWGQTNNSLELEIQSQSFFKQCTLLLQFVSSFNFSYVWVNKFNHSNSDHTNYLETNE